MRQNYVTILLMFALLTLASCAEANPVVVYVTPTPLEQASARTQLVAQALTGGTATSTVVPVIGAPPTRATSTPVVPAATPQPPAIVTAAGPIPTFMGPVIGPDYVLPPTMTPHPTQTPTEGPTEPPPPTREPINVEGVGDIGAIPAWLPLIDPSRVGIQIDWNLSQEDWRDFVGRRIDDDLGARWIKVQIPWQELQPNGPGEYGSVFQRMEQYLQYANNEELNILISVAKAPAWARSNQAESGPPDNPQQLAEFLTFLLSKVPFVDAVEIWNEPNLQREWQGALPFSGAGYMQLFAPAYDAVKAAAPGARVVSAGLAPTGNNPGSRDDRQYLREMYQAGLGRYADIAVGVHPYSWANAPDATCCGTMGWDDDPHFFFADTLRDYREILNGNGHANNELWPTEFGWATWDEFPNDPPEAWMGWTNKWEQGVYTIRAFEIGQTTPGIGPMFLWNLNFALLGTLLENRDERAGYSLTVPLPVMERPAYWMIHDAVRPDISLPKYD